MLKYVKKTIDIYEVGDILLTFSVGINNAVAYFIRNIL